ncbi:MAG: di-trans,poly-cis-decaprenylcistransferase [Myxococcales bacterium]|nr:di-trans,poly-cis-decaprenylcistransferase [Myxococcales bacterium]MCB9629597.1 di-trans,poly-cis-decaprenylcistransferase [Sandaracinaceae bacterium]
MDGNGRWASSRGHLRTAGHHQGSHTVRDIVRECRRSGVRALTLYAFSEQNWERPPHEVSALMELLIEYLVSERSELMDNQIRLRAIGRTHKLPARVLSVLHSLERDTATLTGMTLTLALSYGGQEELADAAAEIARDVAAGRLSATSVDQALLESRLPSAAVGPVDLLIRTGGDQRISNFLLWGAAYAELFFTSKLWPEFQLADLHEAFESFRSRERRFGRVLDAAAPEAPEAAPPAPVSPPQDGGQSATEAP